MKKIGKISTILIFVLFIVPMLALTVIADGYDWYEYDLSQPPDSIDDDIWTNGKVGIGTKIPQLTLTLGQDSNFGFEMAVVTGISGEAIFVSGGTLSGSYSYQVVASDGVVVTKVSDKIDVDVSTPDNAVDIMWNSVYGAISYRVYRTSPTPVQYWTTTATTFIDDGNTAGTQGPAPAETKAYINRISAASDSWLMGGKLGIGTSTPAVKLDIDTGSNSGGLRLRGTEETTEIGDIYMGNAGQMILSTANTGDTGGFIEANAEDDNYGFIIRDSNTGNSVYANLYMTDATTDYLNIVVGSSTTTPGLVVQSGGNVGIGTSSPNEELEVNGNIKTIGTIKADSFEATGSGAIEFSSDIDMKNNLILNIGHANTDFTSGGGLNVAGPVAIGTTNPYSYMLFVDGQIYCSDRTQIRGPTGTQVGILDVYDSSNNILLTVDNYGTQPNIGIGVSATTEVLHVSRTGSSHDLVVDSTTGYVGIGTDIPDCLLHTEIIDSATNTVTYAQRLTHKTSGTSTQGFGTGIEFELEDNGGGTNIAAAIETIWSDATAGSEDSKLLFKTKDGGNSDPLTRMVIDEEGKVGIVLGTGVNPTHELHVVESGNALTGNDVDTSELGLYLHRKDASSGSAVGIGFGNTMGAGPVGAAIIHEDTGSDSIGKLHFATKSSDASSDIPIRVTIDEDGDVGIGTMSPYYPLSIQRDTTNEKIFVSLEDVGTSGNGRLEIGVDDSANKCFIQTLNDYDLYLTDDTHGSINGIMIKDGGNVGVGTAAGSNDRLTVKSEYSTSSYYGLKVQNGGGTDQFVVRGDGLVRIGVNRFVVTETGLVGIGTNPDVKLHVDGNIRLNAGYGISFTDDNTRIYESSDDLHVTAHDDIYLRPVDDIYIRKDTGSDWIRINAGDQVIGIGKTTLLGTNTKLYVVGDSGDKYAGIFKASYGDDSTEVIHAEYTGTGSYNAKAIYGYSKPADSYGIGGHFIGGYKGVMGEVSTTSGGTHDKHYGVWGKATGGNGDNYGLYGKAEGGADDNYGVLAIAAGSTGERIGVFASGSTYGVYCAGDLYATGEIDCFGTKHAIVNTSQGPTTLYCLESPEVWFEDFGEGKLKNGSAHISLDKLFLETVTINTTYPMKVFVQIEGDCNGTYVIPGTTSFDVIELNNGTSNVPFSYRVIAKRVGYEDLRLEYHAFSVNNPFLGPKIEK
jgi:hypothetical protein